jgi:hypothetical protein
MRVRGDGLTSRQMKSLPIGGIFLAHPSQRDYMMRLAQHIGRTDIKIASAQNAFNNFVGTRMAVVVDHAADCSDNLLREIEFHNSQVYLVAA